MKTISLVLSATLSSAAGCSGEPPMSLQARAGLEDGWTCAEIIGPVNNGPGTCPDCYSELCVKIPASNVIEFAVDVDDELQSATELCALTSVLVQQSSSTLFDSDLPISPVALDAGFWELGLEDPLVSANPNASATITVEGEFGRPSCD